MGPVLSVVVIREVLVGDQQRASRLEVLVGAYQGLSVVIAPATQAKRAADVDRSILPAEVQLVRICQSALANVRRHAAARHVSVRLVAKPSTVVLSIEDDGAGFNATRLDTRAGARVGLAIMRERAESLGGTVEVTSEPGRGSRFTVRLTLERREAARTA